MMALRSSKDKRIGSLTKLEEGQPSASRHNTSHSACTSKSKDNMSQPDAKDTSETKAEERAHSLRNLHLLSAAEEGKLETMKSLLNEGADLDAKNDAGDTALHLASFFSHGNVVEMLLKEKPCLIGIRGARGWTPLQNAVMSYDDDNFDIFIKLLERSSKDIMANLSNKGETAIVQAARYGKARVALALLESSHGEKTAGIVDERKRNALHWACINGHADVAKILLEKGFRLDSKDMDGRTPLHLAPREGSDDMMTLLLARRDLEQVLNIQDNDKRTALFPCVALADAKSSVWAGEMIDSGASLAVEDNNAWTCLSYACGKGTVEMVDTLIEKGADVNQQPADGWTALHIAVLEGKLEVTRLLLEKDANADVYTEENRDTALHIAARLGYVDIVGYLLKGGANLEQRNRENQTALELVTQQDSDDCRLINILISIEMLKKLKDGDRDQRMAKLASSTDWNTLQPLVDKIDWEGHTNLKELLMLTCLATDSYPESHSILCSRLSSKLAEPSDPNEHKGWTALHWTAYLGFSDLVLWQLKTSPPKSMKATLKDVIPIVRGLVVGERPKPVVTDPHLDTSTENYQIILDWLWNPPLMQVKACNKRSFQIPANERRKCTQIFDATITDFYRKEGKMEFLPRVRPVEQVIYERGRSSKQKIKRLDKTNGTMHWADKNEQSRPAGPQQIMETALEHVKLLKRKMSTVSGGVEEIEYNKEDLCFRWIHLPANNLDWMQDVTKRVYRDKGITTHDEDNSIPEIIQNSWTELRGSKPEVRYLRPTCRKEVVSLSAEHGHSINTQQSKFAVTNGATKVTEPSVRVSSKSHSASTYQRLALYMPYLTFGTYTRNYIKDEEAGKRHQSLFDIYRQRRTVRSSGQSRNLFKSVDGTLEKDAHTDRKEGHHQLEGLERAETSDIQEVILHQTRTLDEFYYDSLLNTQKRDESQVVWRWCCRNKDERERRQRRGEPIDVLRVDQLWLWVIDSETIITSSTNRIDKREDPLIEGIHEYFREAKGKRRKSEPTPTSVDEMAKFITSFCIDFIDRSTLECNGVELSARQIFAKTINAASDREKSLFEKFQHKIERKLRKGELEEIPVRQTPFKRATQKVQEIIWRFLRLTPGKNTTKNTSPSLTVPTNQETEYLSIGTATDLLVEVKDIRDELNILRYLLTLQQTVWEQLHDVSGIHDHDHSSRQATGQSDSFSLRKSAEKWKSSTDAMKGIAELDKAAHMIQEAVNSILELEQNDTSISEAEQARKMSEETIEQGKTLMAFTIVTIVFLPLSFLTSLFTVNISMFPHRDGELYFTPGYVFPIIFGITTVIVAVVVSWAFKEKLLRALGRELSTKGRDTETDQDRDFENSRYASLQHNAVNEEGGSIFSIREAVRARKRNRVADEEQSAGRKWELHQAKKHTMTSTGIN